MAQRFENIPVLGWAIDDWETFYQAALTSNFTNTTEVNDYINEFSKAFNQYIEPMFSSASLPLNLGGKTDKEKIIATSNPQGIFDFSLASQGLYRVPEYYSEKLAQEFPNKFASYDTIAGIVPPNLVRKDTMGFYYEDKKDGRFPCVIMQKGKAEVDMGVKGAKLKYATRTKDVYLTFKRNRGKVRYVEFYSLFYFTSISGDAQYAIRHIPALMAAEYLESIGIKVRFYMTRFVLLEGRAYEVSIKKDWNLNPNITLPLWEEAPKKNNDEYLLLQPIIAKDFGEDINYPLFFCISSASHIDLYNSLARFTFKNELTKELSTGGKPDFEQSQYREGFERYTNKYKIYNDLGIFKSKELLPEAMIFFHDMIIKDRLQNFISEVSKMFISVRNNIVTNQQTTFVATNIVTTPFFNWWMRLSANNLKNKVLLINSNELIKDIANIESELNTLFYEFEQIIASIPEPEKVGNEWEYANSNNSLSLKRYLSRVGYEFMQNTNEKRGIYGYNILNDNEQVDIRQYITNITDEISTTADGTFFGTELDTKEKRKELVKNIFQALQKI